MTSGNLDNLVRAKQLKTEPPDQQEFEGLLGSAQRRLQDAQVEGLSEEGDFSWPTVRRMHWRWPRCAGTAIVLTTATWFSNVCNTRLAWTMRNGACLINVIGSATWRSTRDGWKSRRSCFTSCCTSPGNC